MYIRGVFKGINEIINAAENRILRWKKWMEKEGSIKKERTKNH